MKLLDFKNRSPYISVLYNSIEKNTVGHAYIITGQEGVGKKSFAKTFAKALNCHGENAPCNVCASCLLFESGNSLDDFLVEPLKQSIGIDVIRDLLASINLKNNMSQYKTIRIYNADKLTIEAQNALLKTLEQPKAGTIFILVASETESVLSTVISRCVKINFSPVNAGEIKNFLQDKLGVSYEKASKLANYAGGSYTRAEQLASDESFDILTKDCVSGLLRLKTIADIPAIVKMMDKYKDNKQETAAIIESLLHDIYKLSLGIDQISNITYLSELRSISLVIGSKRLASIHSQVIGFCKMLAASVNWQSALCALFIVLLEDTK